MIIPKIASVGTYTPPFSLVQSNIEQLTKELFQHKIPRLDRLLKVFENGEIETRNFCVPPDWYREEHAFEERNELYVQLATSYSVEVIQKCLTNRAFLKEDLSTE